MPTHNQLKVLDWGLIAYDEALKRQEDLVEIIASKGAAHDENGNEVGPSDPGLLVFCSHPPTVTLGRKTEEGDVFAWDGPKFEINRGGRATYHGPSQLVIYPIWNLNHFGRDIHKYLRTLEEVLIRTMAGFGIRATSKSGREDIRCQADDTGLWHQGRKLGSIGIEIRKWVTFHGIAINVDYDPKAFQGIRPCGFTTDTMVCMEQLLRQEISRMHLMEQFAENFAEKFLGAGAGITATSSEMSDL